MHDLDLVREDSTFAACEITAAADPESIELWNLVNGGGRWIEPNLAGGWMLTLAPACRAKNLRALAPGLLRRIEANPTDSLARAELEGLGVLNTYHGGTAFPGSIYATIERPSEFTGGWVSDDGDPIVAWLDAWISDAHQAHNLQKLLQPNGPRTTSLSCCPASARRRSPQRTSSCDPTRHCPRWLRCSPNP